MHFELDPNKNESNRQKREVCFAEACQGFENPLHSALLDERFSYFKERWVTIGRTSRARLAVAGQLYLHAEGEEIIRMISAREAYDLSRGIRGRFYHQNKKTTTIRQEDDIILYFKKKTSEKKIGYQTRVKAALRDFAKNNTTD